MVRQPNYDPEIERASQLAAAERLGFELLSEAVKYRKHYLDMGFKIPESVQEEINDIAVALQYWGVPDERINAVLRPGGQE